MLVGQPYRLRPWELDKLTWDEIFELYLKPKKPDEIEVMEADDIQIARWYHERKYYHGYTWLQAEHDRLKWVERERTRIHSRVS